MKVYRSLPDINTDFETSVALGNFDGVHIGHQKILKSAVQMATKLGGKPACFTFSNHPRELFFLSQTMMRNCSFSKKQVLKWYSMYLLMKLR